MRQLWKFLEWHRDPHCRNPKCRKLTSMDARGPWQDMATVDHILSRGLGGSDTVENFQLLCGKCNNQKSKIENLRYIKKEVNNAIFSISNS